MKSRSLTPVTILDSLHKVQIIDLCHNFQRKKWLKNLICIHYWHLHFCFDLSQNSDLYSKCISAYVLAIYPWKFYENGTLENSERRFMSFSRVLNQSKIAALLRLSLGQGTTRSHTGQDSDCKGACCITSMLCSSKVSVTQCTLWGSMLSWYRIQLFTSSGRFLRMCSNNYLRIVV